MKLDKYIPEGQHYQHIADIRRVGYARAFLGAIEIKRDQLRDINETSPAICDEDLSKDIRFRLGAVWALNWVLSIPDEVRSFIMHVPEDHGR